MHIKRNSINILLVCVFTLSITTTGILKLFDSKSDISANSSQINTAYPFTNPIAPSANDPWVIYDSKKDVYYYCWSGGNGVRIAAMDELYDFTKVYNQSGKYIQAWRAPSNTMYSGEIWAPELHKIGNKWYIYVAASDGNNVNHRMYVMESKTEDPMDGFNFEGKITDPTDRWAIDGTVMQHKGKMYFIWSGWEGYSDTVGNGPGQILYIAEMSSPTTISSNRVEIARPSLNWEKRGWVLEGPAAIERNGKMHIMYAASGSWTDDYCVGLLTLTGTDPLKKDSWTKYPYPILSKADGMYGPGHPSITKTRDGREWILYHANQVSGSSWGGRNGWVQLLTWDENNYPVIPIIRIGNTVLDKTPLSNTIATAEKTYKNASIGNSKGKIPQAAADKFQSAINSAKNSWHTAMRQSQISNAKTALETAMSTFTNSVITTN